jgi:hypothetical protein
MDKRLEDLLAERVARRIARKTPAKPGAQDPVTQLVARLTKAGRDSAMQAPNNLDARKKLIKDLSAIVANDPKLKQEINEWAKGKRARNTHLAKPEKKAEGASGGGYKVEKGSAYNRDIGGGGGRLGKRPGVGGPRNVAKFRPEP